MITDLLSPEAVQDPHAVYRALREHAPITWLPEHRAWFVATYDGVHAAFRDGRLSSDRITPLEARASPEKRALLGPTFELLRGWMVFHDPPHHERLRAPARRAFTPKAVESLRPFVTRLVDRCLDEMDERVRAGAAVDLLTSLAFPLPAIVIAELLGVPASDRDAFKTWSNELSAIVFGASTSPNQAERTARGSEPGQTVFLGIAAADRDPAMFPRPDELRLDRPDAFKHLGFGYGLHFCLGAPLARLETQVAVARLVERAADVELAVAPHELTYAASILGRGLTGVPVTWPA